MEVVVALKSRVVSSTHALPVCSALTHRPISEIFSDCYIYVVDIPFQNSYHSESPSTTTLLESHHRLDDVLHQLEILFHFDRIPYHRVVAEF